MQPRGWRTGVASDAGSALVTVGRPPQGIADGADGHAERIEADRGRPGRVADLPAAARCADMNRPEVDRGRC